MPITWIRPRHNWRKSKRLSHENSHLVTVAACRAGMRAQNGQAVQGGRSDHRSWHCLDMHCSKRMEYTRLGRGEKGCCLFYRKSYIRAVAGRTGFVQSTRICQKLCAERNTSEHWKCCVRKHNNFGEDEAMKLTDLIVCLKSKRYANFQAALEALRIAKMYGHCSRVENCPLCRGWHMRERSPR